MQVATSYGGEDGGLSGAGVFEAAVCHIAVINDTIMMMMSATFKKALILTCI